MTCKMYLLMKVTPFPLVYLHGKMANEGQCLRSTDWPKYLIILFFLHTTFNKNK